MSRSHYIPLFAVLFLPALALAATPLPPLLPLQQRLTKLTSPSVCRTRRASAEARLVSQLSRPPCLAQPDSVSSSCGRLRKELQATRAISCPPLPPPSTVATALSAFQSAANAHAARRNLRPPYDTLVLEPAGVVPHVTLVVLNGLGGDRESVAATDRLSMQTGALRAARVLLPLAPLRFNKRLGVRLSSWFSSEEDKREKIAVAAARNVSRLLDQDPMLFGTDRWLAAVGGVSQGAALALVTSLRHRVSATASLAGYLPDTSSYPMGGGDVNKGTEVVFVHGDADRIVPLKSGRLAAEEMHRLGRRVQFVELMGARHDFGEQLPNAIEVGFTGVSRGMFPGWTGREVAPPPLEWKLQL